MDGGGELGGGGERGGGVKHDDDLYYLRVRATHRSGDLAPVLGVGFANDPAGGTPLAITAPIDARWGASLGATVAHRIAPHLDAFVGADADLRDRDRTLQAHGGLRMTL